MAEKHELHESKLDDLEKKAGNQSLTSTLSTPDSPDEKLRILGEQNPYYDHDLIWTAEEEKRLVRIFDLKVLSWIGVMCK